MGPFRLTKALLGALAASARAGRGAVVINISSDAAVSPYSEAKADGVSFLSLDPGDMDTPLHALAVPNADPATLWRPEDAAREIIGSLIGALPNAGTLAMAGRR
jgi:hypothetical protein